MKDDSCPVMTLSTPQPIMGQKIKGANTFFLCCRSARNLESLLMWVLSAFQAGNQHVPPHLPPPPPPPLLLMQQLPELMAMSGAFGG